MSNHLIDLRIQNETLRATIDRMDGVYRDLLAHAAELTVENERLRTALNEIVLASRDDGLAAMCNWMRGRAWAALGTENPLL